MNKKAWCIQLFNFKIELWNVVFLRQFATSLSNTMEFLIAYLIF